MSDSDNDADQIFKKIARDAQPTPRELLQTENELRELAGSSSGVPPLEAETIENIVSVPTIRLADVRQPRTRSNLSQPTAALLIGTAAIVGSALVGRALEPDITAIPADLHRIAMTEAARVMRAQPDASALLIISAYEDSVHAQQPNAFQFDSAVRDSAIEKVSRFIQEHPQPSAEQLITAYRTALRQATRARAADSLPGR
jgi:hypothetical protein